jgi:hypothetical protein
MKLEKITTTFSRGLNQAATHTINEAECQVAENFVFKDRAAVVRKGYTIHAQVCSGPINAIEKFYQPDGDSYFTAIAEGKVHFSVTSGVFTSISSDAISGDVRKSVFDGALYFTDYNSPVKYFNGGQIGIAGLSSPQYKKVLDNCEDYTKWVALDANGAVTQDTTYMHREQGDKSILFSASNPASLHVRQYGGINHSVDNIVEPYHNLTPARNSQKAMCMDTSGNIHIIANQMSGSTSSLIHYRSPNDGSTWSVTQFGSGIYQIGGQIHPNYSGGISLIYNTSSYFKFANWTSQSSWVLSDISGVKTSSNINVIPIFSTAVDRSGHIHLVAKCNVCLSTTLSVGSGDIKYTKFNITSGLWQPTSSIYTSGFGQTLTNKGYNSDVDICTDRSSFAHITWGGTYLGPLPTNVNIGFVHGNSGVLDTSSIYIVPVAGFLYPSRLCADNSANIHISYTKADEKYYHKVLYNGSGYWSAEYNVHPTLDGNQYINGVPLINISSQRLHFIWGGQTAGDGIPKVREASFLSGVWSEVTDHDRYTFNNYAFSAVDGVWSSNNNRTLKGWNVLWWGSGYSMNYKASSDNLYFNQTEARAFNLATFAPDVASSGEDIIQLYVVPNKVQNISTFLLRFYDGTNYATASLGSTSSWRSISTSEYALTISMPKSNFSGAAALNWAACDMQIAMSPTSSTVPLGKVAIDNIRLLKTPPTITSNYVTSARADLTFWGSSFTTRRVDVMTGTPGRWSNPDDQNGIWIEGSQTVTSSYLVIDPDAMQLEGIKQISDPLPNGTYYYKCTFVKESPSGYEIESNPSQQTSGYIVSSNTSSWTYLRLANLPVAPVSFGVSARRMYRRRSQEPIFRYVTTVNDNTETTFDDFIPATALGWAMEEDHAPPPSAKHIFRGSDQRMYYFNIQEYGDKFTSRLRASKPYEPYYCPLQAIDVSPDDGTEGTGIFEYNGIIHLLKERSTWSLQGKLTCANPEIGCVAPDSVAIGKNEVYWLSDQGPIKYNMRFHKISHSLDNSSTYRIQKILDRLPKDYLKNAKGTYYDGYYLLAVTDQGSVVNNLVLCYDTDNDVWSTFPSMEVACWTVWNGYKDGYRLFFGNYSGQICEMFTGNYDISAPISYSIRSKEFGVPTPEEFFRKSYLFSENLDNTVKTLNVQPYYDFTVVSSRGDAVEISGTFNNSKVVFPQTDSASFFSLGVSGSGRVRINAAEIYYKPENLR